LLSTETIFLGESEQGASFLRLCTKMEGGHQCMQLKTEFCIPTPSPPPNVILQE
jgi:hypothetical protein